MSLLSKDRYTISLKKTSYHTFILKGNGKQNIDEKI